MSASRSYIYQSTSLYAFLSVWQLHFKKIATMRSPIQKIAMLLPTATIFSLSSAHPQALENPSSRMIEARDYPVAVRNISDKAHGIIMALAVILILPLGGLSWRFLGSVVSTKSLLWIHVCCQGLGLAMLVTGFGCGIWAAVTHNEV